MESWPAARTRSRTPPGSPVCSPPCAYAEVRCIGKPRRIPRPSAPDHDPDLPAQGTPGSPPGPPGPPPQKFTAGSWAH
eukprot:5821584-Alexandrium_andersonii.AAC.1